jgi:hypothetical protein|eukprot:CAMPEP_0181176380 /NCGR_PEP_ID=MMETSP1096-20121128/4601_1 /TAXON_ID=156174 ORGANISM="Chrysochromulina ericina, Strain CCMP281" /NCGR_SAMPLE_ID=MMETSP1096 /ASSEMBLY_ACC=CAM_ASM_000453 /LENGTH=60 /DNA_ID=CAMNT_0023264469 /DNA_START=143 /DNA_END=325 /DNA_ORIENTATION=+
MAVWYEYGRWGPHKMNVALDAQRGEKLAVNMWLHLYDFQTALAAGCKNEDHAECGDCVPE